MVPITKEEKLAIEKRFEDATFVRTMLSDSKRHHYYCTEEPRIMKFLSNFRRRNVIEEYPPQERPVEERPYRRTKAGGRR